MQKKKMHRSLLTERHAPYLLLWGNVIRIFIYRHPSSSHLLLAIFITDPGTAICTSASLFDKVYNPSIFYCLGTNTQNHKITVTLWVYLKFHSFGLLQISSQQCVLKLYKDWLSQEIIGAYLSKVLFFLDLDNSVSNPCYFTSLLYRTGWLQQVMLLLWCLVLAHRCLLSCSNCGMGGKRGRSRQKLGVGLGMLHRNTEDKIKYKIIGSITT